MLPNHLQERTTVGTLWLKARTLALQLVAGSLILPVLIVVSETDEGPQRVCEEQAQRARGFNLGAEGNLISGQREAEYDSYVEDCLAEYEPRDRFAFMYSTAVLAAGGILFGLSFAGPKATQFLARRKPSAPVP